MNPLAFKIDLHHEDVSWMCNQEKSEVFVETIPIQRPETSKMCNPILAFSKHFLKKVTAPQFVAAAAVGVVTVSCWKLLKRRSRKQATEKPAETQLIRSNDSSMKTVSGEPKVRKLDEKKELLLLKTNSGEGQNNSGNDSGPLLTQMNCLVSLSDSREDMKGLVDAKEQLLKSLAIIDSLIASKVTDNDERFFRNDGLESGSKAITDKRGHKHVRFCESKEREEQGVSDIPSEAAEVEEERVARCLGRDTPMEKGSTDVQNVEIAESVEHSDLKRLPSSGIIKSGGNTGAEMLLAALKMFVDSRSRGFSQEELDILTDFSDTSVEVEVEVKTETAPSGAGLSQETGGVAKTSEEDSPPKAGEIGNKVEAVSAGPAGGVGMGKSQGASHIGARTAKKFKKKRRNFRKNWRNNGKLGGESG